MKRYICVGLVISLLSACSNNKLNSEIPKQVQGQQPDQKLKPPDVC